MYAWTEIRYGGEGSLQEMSTGRGQRYVITKRNIVKQGDEVSQSDVDVDDETWQHWQDEGIVRSYPMPEGMDEYTSASQAFLSGISTGRGEVDIDKLMELGLSNPAIVVGEQEPAEETPVGA